MTDTPPDWAFQRAQELRNKRGFTHLDAFAAYIVEHEAFRQEVSDAVSRCRTSIGLNTELDHFIITKPTDRKLVEVLDDAFYDVFAFPRKAAEAACEAIEKRGGKILWEKRND
jgi:ribosomal protein L15